jgi:carboxylesterase
VATPVAVRAGAEPFASEGGSVGVLLCHGFTGSPASLRPWAEALAAAGFAVDLPLLPGHGTRWQDLQLTRWTDWYATVERALASLTHRCDQILVMGLSMGGTLSLRLAQEHPDEVTGLVLVNPSVHSENKLLRLLPVMRHVVASFPGISNDISLDGQDEIAYDRIPLQAMSSLTELWQVVKTDLPRVDQPILVFGSEQDHVVEPSNAQTVLSGVSSTDREFVSLSNSFHVATLDNDAAQIFSGSIEFARRIAGSEHVKPSDVSSS